MPQSRVHADNAARQRAYRERQAAARAAELARKGLPPTPAVSTMPSTARWTALIETARAALETAYNEMYDYAEERTETWKASARGEAMQERLDELQLALQATEEIAPISR